MACEACYMIIDALKQANKNTNDFQEIANRYKELYDNSQKECEAVTKMLNTLIETVNLHLKGKNW